LSPATKDASKASSGDQTQSRERAKPDPALQAILDSVDSVSPEFGADVLIRLTESSKLSDNSLKIDLLTRAFQLARHAEHPVKRGRMPTFVPDTEAGYSAIAFMLNLDSLSLQARVVKDLVHFNPGKARELLEEVRFPELLPQGCEEPLTYDVSAFYGAVAEVTQLSLSDDDTQNDKAFELVSPLVTNLQSHAQVVPATQLLLNARLSSEALSRAANEFAYSLARLTGDPRGFAGADDGIDAIASVAKLIQSLEAKGLPSAPVLKSLRSYLLTNLNGERCSDEPDAHADTRLLPPAVEVFNRIFKRSIESNRALGITTDELKGRHFESQAGTVPFWQGNEERGLLNEVRELRAALKEKQSATTSDPPPSWLPRFHDLERRVESWQGEGQSAIVYFDEKSILFESLIDLAPAGDERERVINSFVNFLELNSVQRSSAMEWFLEVNRLLAKSHKASFHDELMQSFLESRDPALNLYARFELWAAPAH